MNAFRPEIQHYTFDAVLNFPDRTLRALRPMDIYTRDETYSGWTWLPPVPFDENRVLKAQVTMVPTGDSGNPLYIVTDMKQYAELDVFGLIPDTFARHERSVLRCRDVVDSIQEISLRRFVSNVFSIPNVFHCFWTCPASQRHHHQFAGGLALHSIEMAENIAQMPHLNANEHDIGIAYALLHDIGKIWCYNTDGSYGDPLGHEMAALDQLHGQLKQLAIEWPHGAVAMRSFLSGLWKAKGQRPIMAVAKLVQALDQLSTEQDLHNGCDAKFQPWILEPANTAIF